MIGNNQLPIHLRNSLDLKNFEVIEIISLDDNHPVVVMRDKRSDAKTYWCTQYKGCGHYFETLKELIDYCITRNWIKTSKI